MKKYCDVFGRETESSKSGEIIHEIGRIYRKRSPDKISLIKSAGLLNAAIVRNPLTVSQVQSDLEELCGHILQLANARKQNVNLLKKVKAVKVSMTELRTEVEKILEKSVKKIPTNVAPEELEGLKREKILAIQNLNKTIKDKHKQTMAEVSQYCENVMGEPPCAYAVVGLGSLAREEITPYSDFAHIILLEDEKDFESHLEYFRWYSVIFHVIVLSLQETILPSLNVRSLNGYQSYVDDDRLVAAENFDLRFNWFFDHITPRGISFDGMMPHGCKFPLGRTQHTKHKLWTTKLIKPVSEMLKYLSYEADVKNGYHLAIILIKNCFVYGNESIFQQFSRGTQKHLDEKIQTKALKSNVLRAIKEDLDNNSTRVVLTKLNPEDTINLKRIFRSTTIFIEDLAYVHNISANSCFDIIDELEKRNKATQTTADKLRYAIAIACEIRLRVYANKKSQFDVFYMKRTEENIRTFMDIVGEASTINYFQIAYCLQCDIAKQLSLSQFFFSDPQQFNGFLGLVFEIPQLATLAMTSSKQFVDIWKFNFDEHIKQLEEGAQSDSGLFQEINRYFTNLGIDFQKYFRIGIEAWINRYFDTNRSDLMQFGVNVVKNLIIRRFKKTTDPPSFPLSPEQITNISQYIRAGYVL